MSNTVDGFWKAEFWSSSFWADGFWQEDVTTEEEHGGSGDSDRHHEHKRLRKQTEKIIRSATQIQAERIAARKALKVEKLEKRREQEVKLFTESALLTEQIKQEIVRLGLIEQHAQLARGYAIREQIDQLEQQIEEIDMVFVTFMLIASIDN